MEIHTCTADRRIIRTSKVLGKKQDPTCHYVSTSIPRVPYTKVLSQKIQIFQETSFCVLQVLLLDFASTIWLILIFTPLESSLKVLSNCVF